jgi:hypothetical protein
LDKDECHIVGKVRCGIECDLKNPIQLRSLVENQEIIFRRATTKLENEMDIDKLLAIQEEMSLVLTGIAPLLPILDRSHNLSQSIRNFLQVFRPPHCFRRALQSLQRILKL